MKCCAIWDVDETGDQKERNGEQCTRESAAIVLVAGSEKHVCWLHWHAVGNPNRKREVSFVR